MRDEKQAGQITWEDAVAAHENLHKFLEHLSRNRSRYEESIRLIFEVEEGAKPMARNVTEQLLEQVDGADFGYARHVLLCALKYMSEDEIAKMVKWNELLPDDDKEDIRPEFEYLCELRDSGAINMFGAGRYLEEVFELDKREAKKVLLEWMQWVERERR